MNRIVMLVAAALAAGGFGAAVARADQVTLRAYTGTESNLIYSKIFIDEFVAKVNDAGKGVVQIRYVGGPEITPSSKSAEALERGVVDIVYGPAGYYAGAVPEAYAMNASEKDAAELRADGDFEILDKIWQERINAKFLAWGLSDTGYALFFTEKPTITDKKLDLTGMKIRSQPTYKPLLDALGATPVSIPSAEFYTSLERGLVVGSGWPAVGLVGSGTDKLFKYRIAPDFYRSNHLIIINDDVWKKLSPEAQKILQDAALAYEKASVEKIGEVERTERAKLEAEGIKTLTLTGDALHDYQKKGRDALWAIVEKSSPHAAELRKALTK